MTTTEDMHEAIAEFVREHISQNPDQFTGGFSYRIDVHKVDGSVLPFIYSTDDTRRELWRVSTR